MACSECKHIEHSHREHPFLGAISSGSETYQCPYCDQWWWCFNTYYYLWTMVDDKRTLENIHRGCPEPVQISAPAANLNVVNELREETWGSDGHLTASVLERFKKDRGTLHTLQRNTVEEHIRTCESCRAAAS